MGNKITYNPKTRKDISNPFHNISHNELLKIANVQTFKEGTVSIERLPNGRIAVHGHVKNKK
ncbi:hypothetical protein D3C87_32360 [compost metagenome]